MANRPKSFDEKRKELDELIAELRAANPELTAPPVPFPMQNVSPELRAWVRDPAVMRALQEQLDRIGQNDPELAS